MEKLGPAFSSMSTPLPGLSTEEANLRFQEFGPNEVVSDSLKTKFNQILKIFENPIILILLLACFTSALMGQVFDSLLIALIVLVSLSLNYWQTHRSERAVFDLQKQITPTATVLRDGFWKELPRREIVVGDVIRLSAGDLVPADARLIHSTDLHVLQAALTGESLPAEKFVDPLMIPETGAEAQNLVFMGTSIVSGNATAVILRTGLQTDFGNIVQKLSERPAETEFERGSHQFGILILKTVFFLIFSILIINIGLGRDALQSLLFSLALAVGLTPEFLPMITTVTLGEGALQMARQKVIVKHLSSIQNLGSIDILCSDKTGTITSGKMSLDSSLDPWGQPSEKCLLYAHLNSRFETGIRSPIETAILGRPVAGIEGYSKIDEIPFDFERRRLSVVLETQDQILMITKGAPESVLDICLYTEEHGKLISLNQEHRERILNTFEDLSRQGFRVLGVASRQFANSAESKLRDEKEMIFHGFLTFADHLLEDIPEILQALRQDGIQVKILTGDNETVTESICRQVGMDPGKVILGREIENTDEGALAKLAETANIFARVSPSQKHRIIRALKSVGHVVGYLGDGINDAPSLHSADVGISVAGAADVAQDASDIILLDRKLEVLHAGIILGRKAFGNVFKYLLMETSSNFGNMFSMAGAAFFLPFLPMLPSQILLNNFLYDFAQITIPTDNVDPFFMQKPQHWNMNLIKKFMIIIGPISSVFDFLTFYALLHFFHVDEKLFHTGWFLESLATQTLVLFIIRTIGRPWLCRPSKALIASVLGVLSIGFLIPISPLASALGFTSLPLGYFLFLLLVTLLYLSLVEFAKTHIMTKYLLRKGLLASRMHLSASVDTDGPAIQNSALEA